MKEFASDKIRNVCLAGQRGCGKTSLADAIAFAAGLNNRIGRVDDGTSLLDYTESEISRKTSISLKLLACQNGAHSGTTDGMRFYGRSYRESGVPEGLQTVTASKAGYGDGTATVTLSAGATATLNFSLNPQ